MSTTFSSFPRRQQKKMSTAQTYLVAHTARSKLTREAGKADHNLRLLVGHANLLDSLMLQLAEQEREQETWFNATVPAQAAAEQHVRWVDTISEEEADDSESDSEDEVDVPAIPVRARAAPVSHIRVYDSSSDSDSEDDSEDELDDEEDLESLALVRTHSNVLASPPALVHDSDSDSDDEGPASPPTQVFEEFTAKKGSQQSNDELYHQESLFYSPAPVAAF